MVRHSSQGSHYDQVISCRAACSLQLLVRAEKTALQGSAPKYIGAIVPFACVRYFVPPRRLQIDFLEVTSYARILDLKSCPENPISLQTALPELFG